MIAWWIAQLALLGGLLAVAAYGAESALKVARRPTRWVWVVAMALTVMLGALAPSQLSTGTTATRTWQATAAPADATSVAPATDLLSKLGTAWNDLTALVGTQVQRAWTSWHDIMPDGIERGLLIAWAVASLALLIAFVAVHVRFQRRRAMWPRHDMLGTSVRVANDVGPAVIGVTSAEIVVPHWLLDRDSAEQRLVLEHELEHVRQHDPLLLALAQGAVILLPWNPAVWWMASRLRLAIELDCDRRVLQRGASARAYGTLLIDLTDHRTGFGAALPAFSCTPSHLERRLIAMTPKPLRYPLVRVLSTGALASLALLAACEAKLPTSEEMDNMTAATATSAVTRLTKIDTAGITYFVNNARSTKALAESISADSIATVNIVQGVVGAEIRILTRNQVGAPSDPVRVTYVTPGDTITMVADTLSFPGVPKPVRLAVSDYSMVTQMKKKMSTDAFNGLLIVDGVTRESSTMNTLSPDRIESVNVIKGAAATAKYTDPRAANGVIEITTKKATP